MGHPLEGPNLYTDPKGVRKCRECGRDLWRRYYKRRRINQLEHIAARPPAPSC